MGNNTSNSNSNDQMQNFMVSINGYMREQQ
jgi:hypothetical protein